MNQPRRFSAERLWRQYGLRLMRYAGVTVVTTVVGLATLATCILQFGWSPLFSNFASVFVTTPIAYILNRRWVWGRDGDHSVSGEVGPFWVMTFIGFVVSSCIVWSVAQLTDQVLLILLAQIMSFAVLWLFKFFVLEKLIWGDQDAEKLRETV